MIQQVEAFKQPDTFETQAGSSVTPGDHFKQTEDSQSIVPSGRLDFVYVSS